MGSVSVIASIPTVKLAVASLTRRVAAAVGPLVVLYSEVHAIGPAKYLPVGENSGSRRSWSDVLLAGTMVVRPFKLRMDQTKALVRRVVTCIPSLSYNHNSFYHVL